MWLVSTEVPAKPLHASKATHGYSFPRLETSTWHRTEHHFLVGGENCCITSHAHEFLFSFPVGRIHLPCTIVTVVRFLIHLFTCSRTKSIAQRKGGFAMPAVFRARCRGIIALAHIRGSLRRPRNSTPRLLTCEAALCSVLPPKFQKTFRPLLPVLLLLWRAPRTTMVDPKVSPKISIL